VFCCHWKNYVAANKRSSALKQSTLTSCFSWNTVTEQLYSVWSTLYITISVFKLCIQSKYMYKSITLCVITDFTYPNKFSYLNISWIELAQSCLDNGGLTLVTTVLNNKNRSGLSLLSVSNTGWTQLVMNFYWCVLAYTYKIWWLTIVLWQLQLKMSTLNILFRLSGSTTFDTLLQNFLYQRLINTVNNVSVRTVW